MLEMLGDAFLKSYRERQRLERLQLYFCTGFVVFVFANTTEYNSYVFCMLWKIWSFLITQLNCYLACVLRRSAHLNVINSMTVL